MNSNALLFSLGAFLLAGCATTISGAPAKPAQAAALPPEEGGLALGALAEPGLPKGECGMVLWTLEESRPAPILRYIAGKSADIVIGRAPAVLTLVEASGRSEFGVSEHQVFTTADRRRVKVDVAFGVGFDGGTYLERGLVTVETPDGWSNVAPSAGLAGCRAG